MMATYLSAVLALLLLWNVYPKDFNYGAAAGNGLLFYNANVRGLPPLLSRPLAGVVSRMQTPDSNPAALLPVSLVTLLCQLCVCCT